MMPNGHSVKITTTEPNRLTDKNLPSELVIELDVDPTKIGKLWKNEKKGIEGFEYPPSVNQWLSAAIDKQVMLVHSPVGQL